MIFATYYLCLTFHLMYFLTNLLAGQFICQTNKLADLQIGPVNKLDAPAGKLK